MSLTLFIGPLDVHRRGFDLLVLGIGDAPDGHGLIGRSSGLSNAWKDHRLVWVSGSISCGKQGSRLQEIVA